MRGFLGTGQEVSLVLLIFVKKPEGFNPILCVRGHPGHLDVKEPGGSRTKGWSGEVEGSVGKLDGG